MSTAGKKHWSDIHVPKDTMRAPENPTRLQIARARQDQATRKKLTKDQSPVGIDNNGARYRSQKVKMKNPYTEPLVPDASRESNPAREKAKPVIRCHFCNQPAEVRNGFIICTVCERES